MMQQLSATALQAVDELASRHGFSPEAVHAMLVAQLAGNGTMAQFNHAEFGGMGQWMQGGMTMLSDMFNNHLKARVEALCADIAGLIRHDGGQLLAPAAQVDASTAAVSGDWWGPSLRWPNSSGAQNGIRYAYFAQAHRLALDVGGQVTIYDTLDHQISGVSQQQGGNFSLTFTSQYGTVDLARLPVVASGL